MVLYSTSPKDVESYDPILNPVLNREVRRTGGRVLITLGDQDIDLSPSFVIFLSTRDPTVRIHDCYILLKKFKQRQSQNENNQSSTGTYLDIRI